MRAELKRNTVTRIYRGISNIPPPARKSEGNTTEPEDASFFGNLDVANTVCDYVLKIQFILEYMEENTEKEPRKFSWKNCYCRRKFKREGIVTMKTMRKIPRIITTTGEHSAKRLH